MLGNHLEEPHSSNEATAATPLEVLKQNSGDVSMFVQAVNMQMVRFLAVDRVVEQDFLDYALSGTKVPFTSKDIDSFLQRLEDPQASDGLREHLGVIVDLQHTAVENLQNISSLSQKDTERLAKIGLLGAIAADKDYIEDLDHFNLAENDEFKGTCQSIVDFSHSSQACLKLVLEEANGALVRKIGHLPKKVKKIDKDKGISRHIALLKDQFRNQNLLGILIINDIDYESLGGNFYTWIKDKYAKEVSDLSQKEISLAIQEAKRRLTQSESYTSQ